MSEDKLSINQKMYAPMEFEYLLSYLFGKLNYHGYVGFKELNEWKKINRKVMNTVRKAICINTDTSDEWHKRELLKRCDLALDGIKGARSKDELNGKFISDLVHIIFELMGGFPDHWKYKGTSNPKCWKLNRFRSVNYSQSDEQKFAIIDRIITQRIFKEIPDSSKLWTVYAIDMKRNKTKFLKWFKHKYNDVYRKIFCPIDDE